MEHLLYQAMNPHSFILRKTSKTINTFTGLPPLEARNDSNKNLSKDYLADINEIHQ